MKRYIKATSAILMLGSGLIFAAQSSDMDGAKTPAGKVVAQYLEYTWGKNKNPEAAKKLIHPSMVEHGYLGGAGEGGGAPQGAPPANGPPAGNAGAPPAQMGAGPPGGGDAGAIITPVKIIAQGDLVFVQGHGMRGDKGNGDLMWILYRVKEGKIIEHWDTHDPIPDNQVGKQW